MENYMEYSIMGSVSAIRMKPCCLPSKFECQPDRLKRTTKSGPRPVAVKRQRASLIQEILVQTETVNTPSTSNIGTGDSQVMDEESDLFEMNQNKSTQVCPNLKGCSLVRPPSVSAKSNLTKVEARKTKEIASLRIHIERVIRRYKGSSPMLKTTVGC
ncbi:uncharacterized protein LOC119192128 [Manduca sexta]|uniref:uncharacterized protein LOC119192128 n=1 Tax=Manduca sexta TaxID=7130 RepID=UPI00188DF007|nr:uncharacterized protein LOC119192128 [Manduca sexta]